MEADGEDDEPISPLPSDRTRMDKAVARATRFLSIIDPSSQLPNPQALMKLRQMHEESLLSDEISDELLDKIPFQIEVIPDRHDELDLEPAKTKKTEPASTFVSSGLTEKRRLEIIEEILRKLKKSNVLDDVRQANRVSYRLPERNQMEKNVAERMRQLMGTATVMLNDPVFMRTLSRRLEEERRNDLEKHYEQMAAPEKFFVSK